MENQASSALLKNHNNNSLVEGPYKNVIFRVINPNDYDKVCKNISTYFLYDEPTCKALGVDEALKKEFEDFVRVVLKQNMSFLVEDPETSEIAALRISYIQRKDENIFSDLQVSTKRMKVILEMFKELDEQANIFENYSVEEYAFFFLASTTPAYRNQGLAKELYKRSLAYFKAEGLKIAKVFTSSPYTKAATTSLGFTTLGRLHFKDLKDPETGEKMLNENELNSEDFTSVNIYQL